MKRRFNITRQSVKPSGLKTERSLIKDLIFQCMKQSLEKYCVGNGMFADITFELDDGRMTAHRALLVARCEVMRAMLNGDFREAHAHTVIFCFLIDGTKQ